jgi:N-methylhydantoinase A/oxoprolinase/acetone carboxylase beta subunit
MRSDLHVMTSAAGVATVDGATRQPANLLMSGPVAGLIGGLWAARRSGFESVITLDVGGTSADIGVAPGGKVRIRHLLDTQIAGYHASIPMADVDTIGAGGGSIALVDEAGMFHVGPQSAGSEPGPACYGRGGTRPTVTDAMLVLGKLRPCSFLGGNMRIDRNLAVRALRQHVCDRLNVDVPTAAAGTVAVITHSMIQAIELNSVQKGYDTRDFVLVALGGAGPLFACDIAQELSVPRVVVPPHPGITSALGLLATDLVYDFSTTIMQPLADLDRDRVRDEYAQLECAARRQLDRDGVPAERVEVRHYADCRYVNQGYELGVIVPIEVDLDWADVVTEAFHAEHERTYSRRLDSDVQLVNIRALGVGHMTELSWPSPPPAVKAEPLAVEDVRFGGDTHATAFYSRSALGEGTEIVGPAVIEQFDSTTVVNPSVRCRIDGAGNIVLELG